MSKITTGFTGVTTNTYTYTYDLAGRLTSWDDGTTPTIYTYDKSGNRVQVGTRTFSYDQRNQLTSDSGGTTYQYSARGTLLTASGVGGAVSTDTDAYGQIVAQQVTGGSTVTYTYDGLGRAIRPGFAYTGTTNTLAADSSATYTRGPDGGLLGVSSGGTNLLAWTDGHTDVVGQFTSSGGTLFGSTAYDPLGRVLATTGMLGQLGYQSGWTDTSTGRVNMAARWYNPDTGQFDTRDAATVSPVPDSIGANRFQYGDGNPLTSVDPSGHWSWKAGLKSVTGVASKAWNSAKSYASRAWNAATSYVSSAYNAAKDFISERWRAAKNWVKDRFNDVKKTAKSAREWVADKAEQSRRYIAQKIAEQKRRAQELARNIKQAGKNMVAKAAKNVNKAANAVKDAYKATVQWVKEHKAEIAGFLVGAAVGLGCGALISWTGVGAVACGALVGAVGAAVTGAMKGQRGLDLAKTAGLGALAGMIGGAGGIVGGKLAGAVMSKLGSFAGSLGGRVLGGGLAAGVGDAIAQYAMTGRVDLSTLALATGIGAVTGGMSRGCHSFDPKTRVLMADGSSRRIDEINIGDYVLAKDPETGATVAKPVTALHLNRDTELTDLRISVVRSGEHGSKTAERPSGKAKRSTSDKTATRSSVTVKTTANHPFWDSRAGRWVLAGALAVGTVLATPAGATAAEGHASPSVSVSVEAVRNYAGAKVMRDLTVADIHTYYVIAGDEPVLVHNNNGDLCDIARQAAGRSNTNNTGVAAARDTYTGEVRTGESGAVPGNVNHRLMPGLRQAQEMQANGNNLEAWDPGTCAEFHACNNLMNDVGAHLDEIEFGTVRKEDGSPFPSCGWCRLILGGGGATERTPR